MTHFPTDPAVWDLAVAREDLTARMVEAHGMPGVPTGADADIVGNSLPPYATACPNPYLSEWLANGEGAPNSGGDLGTGPSPYQDPGPFTAEVSEGKTSLFYKAHSYPTKVPHPAIMRFLLHYTQPGDLVLDGFCGTGMTGVAAQACGAPDRATLRAIEAQMGTVQWGYRRAVLADLSPSATFIAAGLNLPIDAQAFERRSAEILEDFEAGWGWMYRTTDDRGTERPIEYVVWSEVFTCPECAGAVVFHTVAFDPATGRVRDAFRCPTCGKELNKDRLERRTTPVRTLAGDTIDRIEFRPVAIHYRVGKAKRSKAPDEGDEALLRRIASVDLPGWVPTNPLPFMHMTHERAPLPAKGFTRVHHFWGDRALVSLAALWKACSAEEDPLLQLALKFWVEQALWGMSWMNLFKATAYSQVNRFQTGVYYVGSLISECSPHYNLVGSDPKRGKRQSLIKAWQASPAKLGQVAISTGSSTRLALPDASVDCVFVDPPFGSNIYYADLAFLVESWHRVVTNPGEEAIVSESKKLPRTLAQYENLMQRCFAEFYRVLKPGRWMTLVFSNADNKVWLSVQSALARVGFMVADTRVIDKQQLSYRQVTARNAVKRDLVIAAYKPASELTEGLAATDPVAASGETPWAFVREHLARLPVGAKVEGALRISRERMAYPLYERMAAFHVHQGLAIPLSAAEFYAGLEQRLPRRDDMYFLPEQVESYERLRLSVKELLAEELFITGEASAVQWLRQFLKSKRSPQGYDRIQPEFFRALQEGIPGWEAMPDLKELLGVNFVTDDAGRWYVPDPRKQADLEKLRSRSLLKEYASYQDGKGELTHFRLEAVRAGFSHSWDRRDFAPIVWVGKRLPAAAFEEDPTLLYYLDNAKLLLGS